MSLSEHERQVLDEIESDLTNVAAYGHLQSRWRRPGARLARAGRGGALVLGVVLIGVGLVHASAAGEAIAVAGYLVLVGALSAVLDARRRRGFAAGMVAPVATARQQKHYAATRRRQRPGGAGLDLAPQDQLGQVTLLG
jgi:predicted phage tail protein